MSKIKERPPNKFRAWVDKRTEAIWTNLVTNHLWQRMVKNTLATTICVILAITPAVVHVFGTAAYLAPIVTVFGHPGRRFGQMAEALVLVVCGALLGIAWGAAGIYLSSLVAYNESAAYTIKGIFLAVALLVHGFLRSHTPRLFIFVVLLVIVSVVSLTGTSKEVSPVLVTTLLYPILTAVGLILLVNCLVFPEFSSSFLGITTIETLGETVGALRDAGRYFVDIANEQDKSLGTTEGEEDTEPLQPTRTTAEKPEKKDATQGTQSISKRMARIVTWRKDKKINKKDDQTGPKVVKLKELTDKKAKLRAKLASCKEAQQECNFELAWSVLPPGDLKAISDTSMKKLVANTISLIGACESKYALLGDIHEQSGKEKKIEHDLDNNDGKKDTNSKKTPTTSDTQKPAASNDQSSSEIRNSHRFGKAWLKKTKHDGKDQSRSSSKTRLAREKKDLELVKPKKEIEFGDIELLQYLVGHITKSLSGLQENIDRSVDVVTSSLAYCYDVKKLPSGAFPPKGIRLEEIDIRVDVLTDALEAFDRDSAAALEGAATLHNGLDGPQVDIMPRMETFLISSFLLNLRQAALHTLEMLKHSRLIVEKRQERHGRRRLYAPNIKWRKWLTSGGEEDMLALPERGKKKARSGGGSQNMVDEDETSSKGSLLKRDDIEVGAKIDSEISNAKTEKKPNEKRERPPVKQQEALTYRLRGSLADFLEYLAESEDVSYAIKLTVAAFLVTFPAFVAKWNNWYHLNRALWAVLQLVLVTEVAIGTSIWTFILRAVGTALGCLWGYAAYEAGHGNRIICVVMIVIGIIPSTYVQLGSKYIKAGMVSIISMCVVALGTLDPSVPGTATENFLRRLITFLIGGFVALAVEILLFPVRARDRLVESLAASISQISDMEACLAYGIESEANVSDVQSIEVTKRFDAARAKAQGALAAAETFLPFCDQEPRLKGSFKGLALIYAEILYVLHAIVDRMDNMLHLRYAYGSGVLEEFNVQVYPYRRNVAGSITLVLFAVHEGLTTKLPLPQYLPSARLSHLRLVNRVREIVAEVGQNRLESYEEGNAAVTGHLEVAMVKRILRKKFLAWNAAAAGQIEVIEYLEELIDLVKLLVGANEFRSGMLTRPTYQEYAQRINGNSQDDEKGRYEKKELGGDLSGKDKKGEPEDMIPELEEMKKTTTSGRTAFSATQHAVGKKQDQNSRHKDSINEGKAGEEGLPRSLQRVRSRRLEEMSMQKARNFDEERVDQNKK